MESTESSTEIVSPVDFKRLLTTERPPDYRIVVGDPEVGEPEKIEVVKWVLIIRSPVMAKMILESPLRNTQELIITDVEPHVFKHFLVYLYGHDKLSLLSIEDAVGVLYLAEKYTVLDLKEKLENILEPEVKLRNIFDFFKYHPICKTSPFLWEKLLQIIQYETDKIFSDEKFVEVNQQVIMDIIEQNQLCVEEVEVWRACLKWAKHQAAAEESALENVSKKLKPLLKYIRLFTFKIDVLISEIILSSVFSDGELNEIYQSVCQGQNCSSLNYLCQTREKRLVLNDPLYPDVKVFSFSGPIKYPQNESENKCFKFMITTKSYSILLCQFIFFGLENREGLPLSKPFDAKGTISIFENTNFSENKASLLIKIDFTKKLNKYDTPIEVSLSQSVFLHSLSKYTIELNIYPLNVHRINNHGTTVVDFTFIGQTFDNKYGECKTLSPLQSLKYRIVEKTEQ